MLRISGGGLEVSNGFNGYQFAGMGQPNVPESGRKDQGLFTKAVELGAQARSKGVNGNAPKIQTGRN